MGGCSEDCAGEWEVIEGSGKMETGERQPGIEKMIEQPPRFSSFLLRIFLGREEYLERSGDLEEVFYSLVEEIGPLRAKMWFRLQALKVSLAFVVTSIYWSCYMFYSFLKMTFRIMKRQKVNTGINILGLAVGFACSMLIGLFVMHELSYDRFNVNADRIYRITMKDEVSTPPAMAMTLPMIFPEIEYAAGFANMRIQPVRYDDKIFYESPVLTTTNDCFRMFSFPLLKGDKASVLVEPNTVVLTRSMAEKYFKNEDPLNRTITIGDNDYRIDGVMEDVPENAHFDFRCLVSNNSFRSQWYRQDNWGSNFMTTYVMLRNQSDIELFKSKLLDFETKYFYDSDADHERLWITQPLTSIHLHSHLKFELGRNGDYKDIIIFATAAIFMIAIAGINFMNLTTAKSMIRVREIGIRKTVGSSRIQLVRQFLCESVLMSLLSLAIGIAMVLLLMPVFHRLIGRPIGLESVNLGVVLPGMVGFAVVIGLFAGVYPALFLSSFRPARVLKDARYTGRSSSAFRSVMVVFQFVVSITLIIGTLTVYRQLDLIQNKDLGFEKEQVLVIKNLHTDPMKAETLKQRLLQHPDVLAVSASGNLPGMGSGRQSAITEDSDTLMMNWFFTDFDYQKTLQLKMAEGRFFSQEFATDTAGLVLNERAVQEYGIENPVGKRITFFFTRPIPLTVIGVVEDFNFESLRQPVTALGMVYGINKGWGTNYISVRLKTQNMRGTIHFIEDAWASVNPSLPFDYSFLDDEYGSLYANEQRVGSVALVFSVLAIAVSCMGLFGLSIFIIERRVKEIGIRKVMGASMAVMVWLLSRQFLRWIVLAFFIAVPLSWFLMSKWLRNFAYRVDLSIWAFLVSGLAALAIALLTVGFQTVKTARANPVDSLRYE